MHKFEFLILLPTDAKQVKLIEIPTLGEDEIFSGIFSFFSCSIFLNQGNPTRHY